MSPYYRVKCRPLIVCMSLWAPTWWRTSSGINVISVAGRTWIGRSSQSGHVQFASYKEMADLLQQDKGQLLAVDFLDRIAIRSRRCGKFLPSSRGSSVCLSVCLSVRWSRPWDIQQEAQLSPRDRAMRRVSWNLASCHATVEKRLVRQVLNQVSAVANWPVRQNRAADSA